ncbi:ankyrin repeat-containing domain protein [Pyronema domesticum]|nr:ankyrin repeat-containing domain protein [Pyronema domesticum]
MAEASRSEIDYWLKDVTPLYYVISFGYEKTVFTFLENGVDMLELHGSVEEHPLIDVDMRELRGRVRVEGHQLIHATVHGHSKIVSLLIEKNCSVSEKDRFYGNTVLHWAFQKGNYEIIRILLEHGTSPSTLNLSRDTPLDRFIACDDAREELMPPDDIIKHCIGKGVSTADNGY